MISCSFSSIMVGLTASVSSSSAVASSAYDRSSSTGSSAETASSSTTAEGTSAYSAEAYIPCESVIHNKMLKMTDIICFIKSSLVLHVPVVKMLYGGSRGTSPAEYHYRPKSIPVQTYLTIRILKNIVFGYLSCPIKEGHNRSSRTILINSKCPLLRSGRIAVRNLLLGAPENCIVEGMGLRHIRERGY